MKKSINMKNKITYFKPKVECIKLDSDISLQLESSPPIGPEETYNSNKPDYFDNTPFQNRTC